MKRNGFILVTSMIFLVLMTLLGLALFGGFTTNQTIAGNLSGNSRAADAAQSALNYAENWLYLQSIANTQHYTPPHVQVCNAPLVNPAVCTNALSIPSNWPWAANGLVTYNLTNNFNNTINAAYSTAPVYYIQFVGQTGAGRCNVYRITAAASSGDTNDVTVIQAIYRIQPPLTAACG